MKRLFSILTFLFVTSPFISYADNRGTILEKVLANNPTLRALRDGVEAEKLDNHTGLTLSDPEVEYSHYWGSPTAMGARNDLSITQSLDYATLFGLKRKMARSKDELADITYEERCHEVLLEASQLLVNVVYYNRCLAEHRRQQSEMQRAVKLSLEAYEAGRINRLDCNKVRLALSDINSTIATEELERDQCLLRLKYLNGGEAVTFTDTLYVVPSYMGRGKTALSEQRETAEVGVAEREVSVARSAGVPQLTMGYVSELTRDEKFRGFTVGLSIPLWSNRNNVKRAKAQLVAARSEQQDALLRLQSEYEALQQRTERLRLLAQTAAESVPALSNASVLHDAFLRGDVSALDYYIELTADYEFHHKALLAERDYQLALNELSFF